MPNIFDGLKKTCDEDIIEQIALLETMNATNISKPIFQKAKKKTISIINILGNKIGKNNIMEEPKVKEIWNLIDEKKDELKSCTREELDERLFEILMKRSKNDIEDPTEDEISIEIIDEAAKLCKIYDDLMPCQKADNIYLKYSEKFNGKAKEYIDEQPLIDLQDTTNNIEESLDDMNKEQKKEFIQSVDVDKLRLLNIGAKMDRQHFARIVWLSVKACGGRFTPKEEVLPSFMKNEKEVEAIKKEEDFKKSREELLELKNKIELCKDKVTSIEKTLQEKNTLLKESIEEKNQTEEEIIDLNKANTKLQGIKKSQEDELEEIKMQMKNAGLQELDSLMEEFKKVKFNVIDINNKISDSNIETAYKNSLIEKYINIIERKELAIKETISEFQQVKMEAQNIIKDYDKKKIEVHEMEKQKINEIFERWSIFFDKFTFEFSNLINVENFSRKELLHIEECLYELHFTKDPIAISIDEIDSKTHEKEKYQCIYASFPDEFEVEIHYKVLNNEEKNVHIAEIVTEF